LAQKKYLALKTEVKKEDDKRQIALEVAQEKEQALFDKKNAVKLDNKQKLAVSNAVKDLVKIESTGDKEKDAVLKKEALESAQKFVKKERKEMEKLKGDMDKLKESIDTTKPSTQKAYDASMKEYYTQKAKFEQADALISKAGAGEKAANEQVDKVRFTRDITDEDKKAAKDQIEAYIGYGATFEDVLDEAGEKVLNEDGTVKQKIKEQSEEQKVTGEMLLQKLEEDAQFQVDLWKRKMSKDASDENKFEYYNAMAEFEMISSIAGDNSPAKKAEK
jgi:hypothetical protein